MLLHLELQTDADAEMGERLAEYAIRLWRRDHLAVRSVVVALRDQGLLTDGRFQLGRGEREIGFHYVYDILRFWQIPAAQVLAQPDVRLAPSAVAELMWRSPMIQDLIEASSFTHLMRDRGRHEGRQEGQREMAQAILVARFGPLQPDELAALRDVDSTSLGALAASLATDSREQVRARLGLPADAADADADRG